MPRRRDSSDDDDEEDPLMNHSKSNSEVWSYLQWVFVGMAVVGIVLILAVIASWIVVGYLDYKVSNIPAGPIGSTGATGATGAAGSSGSIDPSLSHYVYVSVGGNDTTGTGQLNNPLLTVSKAIALVKALAAAQNSTVGSLWTIFIMPGVYGSDVFALPANVVLQGFDGSIVDNTTSVSIDPLSFNVTGATALPLEIASVVFNGNVVLDLSKLTAIGGAPIKITAEECKFMGGFSFLGRSASDEYDSRSNYYQGNVTVNGGTYQMVDDYQTNGNLLVTDSNLAGTSATSSVSGIISGGATVNGAIYITKTIDATFTQTIQSHGTLQTYLLYVNGAIGGTYGNMTLFTDTVSVPSTTNVFGYVTWKNK